MKLKNVQGLRAVAVCLVLLAHSYAIFDADLVPLHVLAVVTALGRTGVDLFFVISGFIMVSVHWSNFGDSNITRTFLVRRIVRIVPLYWLLTLMIALLFAMDPSLVHSWPRNDLVPSLLLLPMHGMPLLFVGWTLIYEMYFYYVFGALLNLTRQRAFAGLGIWAAIIVLAQLWSGRGANPFAQEYLNTLVLEFLFGVCIGTAAIRGITIAPATSVGIGTLLLFASLTYVLRAQIDFYVDGWNLRFLSFGLPMALIAYGFITLERNGRFVMPLFAQRVGDASYSIYLWHTIVYAAAGRIVALLARHVAVPWPWLVVVPIATVLVCLVLYDRIEVPLLRLSRNVAARAFPTTRTA